MHKNYGVISHTNAGYTNHTNSYNNHTNFYSNHTNSYSNHTNVYNQVAESYSNYTQRGYGQTATYGNYSRYGCSGYSDSRKELEIEELELDGIDLKNDEPTVFYSQSASAYINTSSSYYQYIKNWNNHFNIGGPSAHSQYLNGYAEYGYYCDGYHSYKQYSNWGNYRNHTQNAYSQSSYSKSGYNNGVAGYSQAGYSNGPAGYNQAGYANMNGSQYGQYAQDGYNNHSNSGYTNHVNTTTNVPPTKPTNLSRGVSAYYKSTITLTWQRGTDNDKAIQAVSGSFGQNDVSLGIWENATQVIGTAAGIVIGYWNTAGHWAGYIHRFPLTQGVDAAWELVNFFNAIPNGCFVAVCTYDEPYTNSQPIIDTLYSHGVSSLANLDYRGAVAAIIHKGVGVSSQQTVRYFGTNGGKVSASAIIGGVGSAQPLQTDLQYAFKQIGGTYGSWTTIGTVDGESYNYNLSNHGNGHIKFRARMSDHVEVSDWIESSEVRVLKYDAPSGWTTTASGTSIANTDAESLKVEINKLCSATGNTQSSVGNAIGVTVQASHITDFRNKLNAIGASISKANLTDTNTGIIYAADVQNIKNWIKGV